MATSIMDLFYNKIAYYFLALKPFSTFDENFDKPMTSWIGKSIVHITKINLDRIKEIIALYGKFLTYLSDKVKTVKLTFKNKNLLDNVSREKDNLLKMKKGKYIFKHKWQQLCGIYETDKTVLTSPTTFDIVRVLVYKYVHTIVRTELYKLLTQRDSKTKLLIFPIPMKRDVYLFENEIEEFVNNTSMFKLFENFEKKHVEEDIQGVIKSIHKVPKTNMEYVNLLLKRRIIGFVTNEIQKYHRHIKAPYINANNQNISDITKSVQGKRSEMYRSIIFQYTNRKLKFNTLQNRAELNRLIEYKYSDYLRKSQNRELKKLTLSTYLNFVSPLKKYQRLGHDKGIDNPWTNDTKKQSSLILNFPLTSIRDCSFYTTNNSFTSQHNEIKERTISPYFDTFDVVGLCYPFNQKMVSNYNVFYSGIEWFKSSMYEFKKNKSHSSQLYLFNKNNVKSKYGASTQTTATSSQLTGSTSEINKTRSINIVSILESFIKHISDINLYKFKTYINQYSAIKLLNDFMKYRNSIVRVYFPLICNESDYVSTWSSILDAQNIPRKRLLKPVEVRADEFVSVKLNTRQELLSMNQNCQHYISWKFMRTNYRHTDDVIIQDRQRFVLYEFMNRFVKISEDDKRVVCRSCGAILKLDDVLREYRQDNAGRVILLTQSKVVDLKTNPKYSELIKIIDKLNSYLELTSEIIGIGYKYDGLQWVQEQKRQSIIRDVIDTIRWMYYIENILDTKAWSNDESINIHVSVDEIENDIHSDLSKRKFNVLLALMIVYVILNLTPNDVMAMATHIENRYDTQGKKEIRNIMFFESVLNSMFDNIELKHKSPISAKDAKVLAYLIFRMACVFAGISIVPQKGKTKLILDPQKSLWYPIPMNKDDFRKNLNDIIRMSYTLLNSGITMINRIEREDTKQFIQSNVNYNDIKYVFQRMQSRYISKALDDNSWFSDDKLLSVFYVDKSIYLEENRYKELTPQKVSIDTNLFKTWKSPRNYKNVNYRFVNELPTRASRLYGPIDLFVSNNQRVKTQTVNYYKNCDTTTTKTYWTKMLNSVKNKNTVIKEFVLNVQKSIEHFKKQLLPFLSTDGIIVDHNYNGNILHKKAGLHEDIQFWYPYTLVSIVTNVKEINAILKYYPNLKGVDILSIVINKQLYYFHSKTRIFLGHKTLGIKNQFKKYENTKLFKFRYTFSFLKKMHFFGSVPNKRDDMQIKRNNLERIIRHFINIFYYISSNDGKCEYKMMLYHTDLITIINDFIKKYDMKFKGHYVYQQFNRLFLEHKSNTQEEFDAILVEFLTKTKELFKTSNNSNTNILYLMFYYIYDSIMNDCQEIDTLKYNEFKFMYLNYKYDVDQELSFISDEPDTSVQENKEMQKDMVEDNENEETLEYEMDNGYGADDTDNDVDDIVHNE